MEVCPPPRLRAGSERGQCARQKGCACASSGLRGQDARVSGGWRAIWDLVRFILEKVLTSALNGV